MPDLAEARCGDNAWVRGRFGASAEIDQGARPLHAVGDRPLFPVGDARYEAAFIRGVDFKPIPSLWGHTAGRGSNPADAQFQLEA